VRSRSRLLASLLLIVACAAALAAPVPEAARPTSAEVDEAVKALQHDPNLGEKKTIRSLRWDKSTEKKPPPKAPDSWLLNFFKFISQTSMALIWVLGAIAIGICIVWILRIVRNRDAGAAIAGQSPPSHIRDLDVRPSSLPDDIGSAARALLDAGRIREALSLLYRGALSRVIHRHAVVIAESFTEGEVLVAVRRQLNEDSCQYFARLLVFWQREVYAADHPALESIAVLCAEFAPALEVGR
jgi:hypothetical protein